jgi:ADP-ribose pyrophosphatase YjhB (NUDIX family)
MWTLPAGFMENDETVAQAALRETREEANASVELNEMFTVISVPHISQVHVIFLAKLMTPEYSAGQETLEVALVREDDVPWHEIAFRTIAMTLRHYFADRRAGVFTFHHGEIARI